MNHSNMKFLAIAVLFIAIDCTAGERVHEVFKTFTGSAAPIAMDLNDDGVPALRAIGGGAGSSETPEQSWRSEIETSLLGDNPTHGEFTADNVGESAQVSPPTGKCAADELESEMIYYSSVHRYSNGDLLIGGMLDGFTCANPVTGLGYGVVRIEYIGGTGLFEGARGETIREFQAQSLDPLGLRTSLVATERGTLILPATP